MGRRRVLTPDCSFPPDGEDLINVPSGDSEFPNITVNSVDVGPVNFSLAKVTLSVTPGTQGQDWNVILERVKVMTLKCGDTKARIETVIENLFIKLNHPEMQWFWEDSERQIIVERQVDHIAAVSKEEKESMPEEEKEEYEQYIKDKKKKRNPEEPKNFAIYSALRAIELARKRALICVSEDKRTRLGISDNETVEDLVRPSTFVPASGHKKALLSDVHGDERKKQTGPRAKACLESEGQLEASEWMGRLKKQKPFEDVGDVYLQARRHLEDIHKGRLKEKRKEERERKKRMRAKTATTRMSRNNAKKRSRSMSPVRGKTPRLVAGRSATAGARRTKKPRLETIDLTDPN